MAYKALREVSPIVYSEFTVVKDGVKLKVPYGEYTSSFSPFRKNCFTIANALIEDGQLVDLSDYDFIVTSWTFSELWSVMLEQNFRCRVIIDDKGIKSTEKHTHSENGIVTFVDEQAVIISRLIISDFDKILDHETFIANK